MIVSVDVMKCSYQNKQDMGRENCFCAPGSVLIKTTVVKSQAKAL